eukprot:3023016-Rhodomonas_salina.2
MVRFGVAWDCVGGNAEGRKGKSVCGVKLGDGSTLEADAVVMAVGMQAMQGIIRSSEVGTRGLQR